MRLTALKFVCLAGLALHPVHGFSTNAATHSYSEGTSPRVTGYAVTGRVDCTFYRSGGDVFTNQTVPFEVVVDEANWRVKSYEPSGAYWIRGSDGDGVYHLFVIVEGQEVNTALVEPGKVPTDGYPGALPWLAFASGDFFSSGEELPFAPWASPFFEPSVCAYKATVSLLQKRPFLPSRVDFTVSAEKINAYESSRYIKRSKMSRAAVNEQTMRLREYREGFKGGYYAVTDYTNFAGLLLPLRFELVALRPAVGPRPNSPLAATYKGVGLSYSTARLESGLPQIGSQPTAITDLRFRTPARAIDGLRYWATNQWETDTNSPRLIAAYKARLNISAGINPKEKRRIGALLALGLAALSPVVYLVSRKMRRSFGKNSQSNVGHAVNK